MQVHSDPNTYLGSVWIQRLWATFVFFVLVFFFFFVGGAVIVDFSVWTVHTSGSHALFMGLTNLTFQQLFIKNWYHGTIHTFGNYFLLYFQLYLNRPLIAIN